MARLADLGAGAGTATSAALVTVTTTSPHSQSYEYPVYYIDLGLESIWDWGIESLFDSRRFEPASGAAFLDAQATSCAME